VKRFVAHQTTIWRLAFSPDGEYLVTSSGDSSARVWETRTWTGVATLQAGTFTVWSAAFSPDSQWVVTTSDDLTTLWSVGSWIMSHPLRS